LIKIIPALHIKHDKMKHIKFTLFAVFQLLILTGVKAQQSKPAAASNDDRGYTIKVGDQAPDDFELVLTDGTKTSLKKLRGKIVVLQFTASWCSVCREEITHLENEVWKDFKDKNVVLIGIDRDEPLAKVQKYHQDMHVTYPFALDPGANIFGRFADKKSGVTRNVVIDANGKIIYLTRLYDNNEFNGMVKEIGKLVN